MSYTPGPLPAQRTDIHQFGRPEVERLFTAGELRDHAAKEVASAVACERERCARICQAAESLQSAHRFITSGLEPMDTP